MLYNAENYKIADEQNFVEDYDWDKAFEDYEKKQHPTHSIGYCETNNPDGSPSDFVALTTDGGAVRMCDEGFAEYINSEEWEEVQEYYVFP